MGFDGVGPSQVSDASYSWVIPSDDGAARPTCQVETAETRDVREGVGLVTW
jgi:hypothetical protein